MPRLGGCKSTPRLSLGSLRWPKGRASPVLCRAWVAARKANRVGPQAWSTQSLASGAKHIRR
eukprot:6437605-Pyramimonas_sp.AAC.1